MYRYLENAHLVKSWMRIPMMSFNHSDLMPIRSERSDAGLSQCELASNRHQSRLLLVFSVLIRRRFPPPQTPTTPDCDPVRNLRLGLPLVCYNCQLPEAPSHRNPMRPRFGSHPRSPESRATFCCFPP
jgi:hypothetical protein